MNAGEADLSSRGMLLKQLRRRGEYELLLLGQLPHHVNAKDVPACARDVQKNFGVLSVRLGTLLALSN